MKIYKLLFALLYIPIQNFAQSSDSLLLMLQSQNEKKDESKIEKFLNRFTVASYGSLNYNNYDWQIWKDKRSDIDMERIVLMTGFKLNDKYKINSELEFEHGGTGVTVEFDRFEEFGEFEYEVEKGGEVLLEEFNVEYAWSKKISMQVGRIKVPFGLINYRDEPTEYFTNHLAEGEATMLPTGWSEYGLKFLGKYKLISFELSLTNGLDCSAFSSANFVKRGHQLRFESVVAEDLAVTGRFDLNFGHEKFIGVSGYFGNTTHNRPKPDLKADAYLALVDFHALYELEPFEFSASVIYGQLQNSDLVSEANRNLSNNLNVKRTPVGHAALAYTAELAIELWDLAPLFNLPHPNGELNIFGRYDFYDTMYEVEGLISDNPRWERKTITAGINYMPNPYLVFKTQYSQRKISVTENNIENTFSLGFGFYFY